MATATFRHEGAAIDYTPGAAVAAGDVVVQGEPFVQWRKANPYWLTKNAERESVWRFSFIPRVTRVLATVGQSRRVARSI